MYEVPLFFPLNDHHRSQRLLIVFSTTVRNLAQLQGKTQEGGRLGIAKETLALCTVFSKVPCNTGVAQG